MLKNVMKKHPLVTCAPQTNATEIARLMRVHDVGAVLICVNQKPVGIITDRDLVLRCLAANQDPQQCNASQFMTSHVACANETDGIYDVISLMLKSKIRRIPVIDAAGKAVGIISHGDLIALLSHELHDLSQASTHFEELEKAA